MATILELAVALLLVALATALYVWTRRTEGDYEPRVKSEDEANALRLGIALNNPGSANVNGR